MKKNIRTTLLLAALLLPLASHAIKIAHGPYLQSVRETEATIVWTADAKSVGWVELVPDDGTNFYASERPRYWDTHIGIKTESRIHSVRLTGLRPGTTYRYRVYAQEVKAHSGIHVHYGNAAAGDVWSRKPLAFTTLDEGKAETSFVVLNDIHGDTARLSRLTDFAEVARRDLVFFNGDMLSLFDKEEKFFGGFMDLAVKRFASEKPLYYVRGNHETRGELAPRFHDYVVPREPSLYFAFRQGPVFFICLDTGEDKPDTDIEYAGITDYDRYRTEQAEWLRTVVASPEFRAARHHVVIQHVKPLKPGDPDAWHGDIDVWQKLVSVLDTAPIDLMICGHKHRFSYDAPSQNAKFPVLTNDNKSAVVVETQGGKLHVRIIADDGKTTWSKTF